MGPGEHGQQREVGFMMHYNKKLNVLTAGQPGMRRH